MKRQRVELDNTRDHVEGKLLTVEHYLAHAAICTHLAPHLVKTHPPSPPMIFPSPQLHVPCIFAGQGPPDSEDEGTDTCTVLGKRLRCHPQKPVFPYCLKCNELGPDHPEDLCPLWKMCRWCISTQHAHTDCPSPYVTCELKRCVVTYDYANYGSGCLALPSAALSYEMQLAAWDYDEELYKRAT